MSAVAFELGKEALGIEGVGLKAVTPVRTGQSDPVRITMVSNGLLLFFGCWVSI
jgi:hypothetical protein